MRGASASRSTRTITRVWTVVSACVNRASPDYCVTTALTGKLDYCNSVNHRRNLGGRRGMRILTLLKVGVLCPTCCGYKYYCTLRSLPVYNTIPYHSVTSLICPDCRCCRLVVKDEQCHCGSALCSHVLLKHWSKTKCESFSPCVGRL